MPFGQIVVSITSPAFVVTEVELALEHYDHRTIAT